MHHCLCQRSHNCHTHTATGFLKDGLVLKDFGLSLEEDGEMTDDNCEIGEVSKPVCTLCFQART